MLKKIILLLLISLIAFCVKNLYFRDSLNPEILNKLAEMKNEISKVTAEQKKSVHFMLAYNLKNPYQLGEKLFTAKNKVKTKHDLTLDGLDVNFSYFIKEMKGIEIGSDEFVVFLDKYIKNNQFLSSNLDSYLNDSLLELRNISQIPPSYFSTNPFYSDYFKFLKSTIYLVIYDHLKTGKVEKIKTLNDSLFELAISEAEVLDKLLSMMAYRLLNKFIVAKNIIDLESQKKIFTSKDSIEEHQKILLNEKAGFMLMVTGGAIEKFMVSKDDYLTNELLSSSTFSEKVKVYSNHFLLDPIKDYNQSYTEFKAKINDCFDRYQSCAQEFDVGKDDSGYLGHSAFRINYFRNFHKMREITKAITQ